LKSGSAKLEIFRWRAGFERDAMELYKRPMSVIERKTCHGVEEYVWWNRGLVALSLLRELFRQRLAVIQPNLATWGSAASGDVNSTLTRGETRARNKDSP
jgi:hypothetical protein